MSALSEVVDMIASGSSARAIMHYRITSKQLERALNSVRLAKAVELERRVRTAYLRLIAGKHLVAAVRGLSDLAEYSNPETKRKACIALIAAATGINLSSPGVEVFPEEIVATWKDLGGQRAADVPAAFGREGRRNVKEAEAARDHANGPGEEPIDPAALAAAHELTEEEAADIAFDTIKDEDPYFEAERFEEEEAPRPREDARADASDSLNRDAQRSAGEVARPADGEDMDEGGGVPAPSAGTCADGEAPAEGEDVAQGDATTPASAPLRVAAKRAEGVDGDDSKTVQKCPKVDESGGNCPAGDTQDTDSEEVTDSAPASGRARKGGRSKGRREGAEKESALMRAIRATQKTYGRGGPR